MANNYTQFAEVIKHLTDEEMAWLRNELVDIDDMTDDEHEAWLEENKGYLGTTDLWPDFGHELVDNDRVWGNYLYVYSEERGSVEQVAELLCNLLAEFDSDRACKVEWADTCSKPRPDNFGGGAAFITAEGIEWFSTGKWLHEMTEAHEKEATGRVFSLHQPETKMGS
jgi:hypothetical protein